jgi:hypothetical protein
MEALLCTHEELGPDLQVEPDSGDLGFCEHRTQFSIYSAAKWYTWYPRPKEVLPAEKIIESFRWFNE